MPLGLVVQVGFVERDLVWSAAFGAPTGEVQLNQGLLSISES
jgi:hypothetical protein